MAYDVTKLIRAAKRIQEATGYLELGMAQHTLQCLEGLDDAGLLKDEIAELRSSALRLQHGHSNVLLANRGEESEPRTKDSWLTLSLCYRLAGNVNGAVEALACARGAKLPPSAEYDPAEPADDQA